MTRYLHFRGLLYVPSGLCLLPCLRRAILTARPEERRVARLVAVWLAVMLSVVARDQRLVALLASQTGAVPVLPQGRLSLSCGHKQRH